MKTNNEKEECRDIDEKKVAWNVLKIIGMVILGIVVCVLLGFVIMWLWNWLMPMIFGLTKISYWQAVGIFILSKLIFGGFGTGGNNDGDGKKKMGTIRHTIKKEIKKEFNKEFDKGTAEKEKPSETESQDYDEMYEKWWETQGEKNFENYMKNKSEKNE